MITKSSFMWLFMSLSFSMGILLGAKLGIDETKRAYGTTHNGVFK